MLHWINRGYPSFAKANARLHCKFANGKVKVCGVLPPISPTFSYRGA
jgi:hypothetical protein